MLGTSNVLHKGNKIEAKGKIPLIAEGAIALPPLDRCEQAAMSVNHALRNLVSLAARHRVGLCFRDDEIGQPINGA
jgi:hypothetical protein